MAAPDFEPSCLFCRIAAGTEKAWKVWEDTRHVAFLTPFPNTPGFTVIATRAHRDSNVLALEEGDFQGLMAAARQVAGVLDRALHTRRTALLAEGMGINHAHVKLVPLHGIPEGPWKPMLGPRTSFTTTYEGYVTSLDGPRVADEELDQMAARIREAATRG